MDYIHSGDFGDIIYFLPALKANPGKLFIKPSDTTRQKLTPQVFAPLLPLLKSQSYVESVEEYTGQEATDANQWRESPTARVNLAVAQLTSLKVPLEVLDEKWLEVKQRKIASQVVNRTNRYHGKFPAEVLDDDVVFIGLEEEYSDFCKVIKKIPYYKTQNLLDAAEVIAGADLFIGNQSACYAIAEGLKQNAVLEVSVDSPNCIFHRSNVRHYYPPTDRGRLHQWLIGLR